jgi:predicted metal-binding membrane protein
MSTVCGGAATTSTKAEAAHGEFTPMSSQRPSQRMFFSVLALLFTISVVLTIVWCGSMSSMRSMPMPGGWTMSMTWMRMPGQTWAGAALTFLAMWLVMMVAMMLPSFVPAVWRYRQALVGTGESHPGRFTVLAGLGYFFVWTALGMIAFPAGAALSEITMRYPAVARAVPAAVCVVVLIAGALQFSRWKAHHLGCCRVVPVTSRIGSVNAAAAWWFGLRLGLHCSYCCAGLTAILFVLGIMDLRAMTITMAAITLERLAPAGERVARAIGAIVIVAGLLMTARVAGVV